MIVTVPPAVKPRPKTAWVAPVPVGTTPTGIDVEVTLPALLVTTTL
jgi:hypothetical protein